MRNSRLTRTVATLLAVVISAAGCSGSASDEPAAIEADSLAATASYPGEQLYAGIVLAQGPVAALFPELSRVRTLSADRGCAALTAQATKDAAKLGVDAARVQRVLRGCATATARSRFASADVVLAQLRQRDATYFTTFKREISSGDHLRVERALVDGGRRLLVIADDLNQNPPPDGRFVCAVVAAFAAVAIAVWFWFWVDDKTAGATGLERQTLIDTITARFAQRQ